MLRPIGQAKNVIAAEVKHARFVPAHDKGRVPMKTRRLASFGRLRFQDPQLARAHVKSMHHAFLVIAVKGVAISRIEEHIKSIGARERRPITVADAFLAADSARSNPVAIILQSTRDSINWARIV